MTSSEKITLPWQNLREWDGSVRKAFEQMCNQFASCEDVAEGCRFVPVAAPDGGVECYWVYPNGSEWAFQAKFWTSPEQVDFSQLDSSIRKALQKHPRLIRYTVCLPIDRPDPRIPNESWLKDKWDIHEAKWKSWATAKGISVDFDYWGETDLTTRFSMEKHAGRHYFWFHRDLFSDRWFTERLEEARANVGVRYTPDLNISLDLARVFDALVRGRQLHGSIKYHVIQIRKFRLSGNASKIESAAVEVAELNHAVETVLERLSNTIETPINRHLDLNQMVEPVSAAISAAKAFARVLRNYDTAKRDGLSEKSTNLDRTAIADLPYMLNHHASLASALIDVLQDLYYFVESEAAQAADAPAVLLIGNAGIGKTHLLCDFAFSQLDKRAPAVLLLGQHFWGTENPWVQTAHQLGIHATPAELLGALNAAGQLRGVPAVLMIDALNEGQGRSLWHSHLAGALVSASRYPFVRVVLSIRRTYLDACIPGHLSDKQLLSLEHHGFAENVIDAVGAFFDHYKIVLPAAPILDPEFQNPLFLKIFCQSLFNRGEKIVPKGMTGMNAIFASFIDSIDGKLSKSDLLDYPRLRRVVFKATEHLADAMALDGSRMLEFDAADNILQTLYPSSGYEQSLLRHLISEGLVSQDMMPGGQGVEAIQFAYERMSDYLVAKRLLEKHFDPMNPTSCFHPGGPLHNLVETERAASMQQGLLEAMSVHLPELHGVELADIVGTAREFRAIKGAFTGTFALRSETSFTAATNTYINTVIARYRMDRYQLNEALINLAAQPGHPFNAERLHATLSRLEMSERDELWTTTYLWESFSKRGAARRLVEWTTGESKLDILDDASRGLIGLALGWILTSSNRTQRDTATKGLVRLFTDRLQPLLPVLQKLADANDPYVVERILGAAYGAAMRSRNDKGLEILAQWLYDRYFASRRPAANILIRDYARGIVELALHRGASISCEPKNIRPPYLSEWPEKISSRKELEALYGRHDQQDEEIRRAWYPIFNSVMGHGDFARYVIGTNWGTFPWLSTPLTKPRPKNTSRYRTSKDNLAFKLDVAQRWIFDRVVKLGWTPERFKNFDREINNHHDREDKPERIGKKYQWIAYYEFVALVADHFYYASNDSGSGDREYEGPWQVTSARNIDPSNLLTRSRSDQEKPAWWLKLGYSLQANESVDTWLRNSDDVPDLSPTLQVADPSDGTNWLLLEGSCKVTDPKAEGEDRFARSFRQVWVEVRAYLVKKTDEKKVFTWFSRQDFWGRWMHENHPETGVFMGEYFWAPAYQAVDNAYNGRPGWSQESRRDVPNPIADTCSFYLHERGYDCSVEEGINITLPSKTLSVGLNLTWSGRVGVFNDKDGQRAAFDPSVIEDGPGALLVRRDLLENYLESQGLVLVWAAFGGKQYMQSERHENDWKGEMQMNGAYKLTSKGVKGRFRGEFRTQV
jgi:hypothetical protein